MPSVDEVQVPKAAELVAAHLRRQIITGELAEGVLLLPELRLVTALSVSRPTLRQALRILENEGLVKIQRGRNGGTRVNRPSIDNAGRYLNNLLLFEGATLADVHTAQLLLEPAAVAEIAGRLDVAAIASLREAVAESTDQSDPVAARRRGSAFHVKLVELTGNRPLALFARLVNGLLDAPIERRSASRLRRGEPPQSPRMLGDHSRVVDLIEAGAAREAARHWRQHLAAVHELLQKTVNTGDILDLEP